MPPQECAVRMAAGNFCTFLVLARACRRLQGTSCSNVAASLVTPSARVDLTASIFWQVPAHLLAFCSTEVLCRVSITQLSPQLQSMEHWGLDVEPQWRKPHVSKGAQNYYSCIHTVSAQPGDPVLAEKSYKCEVLLAHGFVVKPPSGHIKVFDVSRLHSKGILT